MAVVGIAAQEIDPNDPVVHTGVGYANLVAELDEGDPNGQGAELYLRVYTIWPKFKEWAERTRWEGETLKESAFRRQLAEEPYCLERRHQLRFSRIVGGNTSVKCMRLDYAKMLAMGLEVEGFAEQA